MMAATKRLKTLAINGIDYVTFREMLKERPRKKRDVMWRSLVRKKNRSRGKPKDILERN